MKDKILLLVAVIFLTIFVGIGVFNDISQKDDNVSAVTTESTLFYRSDIASTSNATVTVDARILATSSTRIYARIINNCASIVFLQDAADVAASLTSGFALAANGGVWDSNNENFIYTGAVRASSTDETSCRLHVIEY